jgi:hypothetical protein
LVTSFTAEAEGVDPVQIVQRLLDTSS